MYVTHFTLNALAEWEPAESMTDATLRWESGSSIGDVLQMLKRWRQLCRLTLRKYHNRYAPSFEMLRDSIMGMKHLSYLHIVHGYDRSNCDELEILRDKVNELILPRRPNFTFDISRIY